MKAKFTTTLDKELLERLKIEAVKQGKNVNEILEELIEEYLKGDSEMTKSYELQIELNNEYEELGTFDTKEELMEQHKIYKDEDKIEGHNNNYYCREKTDEDVVNFYQL